MTSERQLGRRGPAALPGFEFEPHQCFACGELNEHGLHLRLHVTPEECWAETTLAPRFQGWEGVAHGGVVTTILDEVMAWAVIGRDTWGVTARISVTFRKPVPIGKPIRAEGRVVEDRRRTFRTAGRVLDGATGQVLAEAEGTFVAAPPDELARLKARYRLRQVSGSDDATDPGAGGGDTPDRVATLPGGAQRVGRR